MNEISPEMRLQPLVFQESHFKVIYLIFLIAEGHSVPGPILEIGNTNSRYKFSLGLRQFVNDWNSHGPAHHCAIGVGHIASKIKKLGSFLEIPVVQVC